MSAVHKTFIERARDMAENTNTLIKSAADLVEPEIRTEAPFYALFLSSGLVRRFERSVVGDFRSLRFAPTKEARVIDERAGVHWRPLPTEDKSGNWIRGEVTMNPMFMSEFYPDYSILEKEAELLPDVMVFKYLTVSEKVRDLICKFAPSVCDFAPVSFVSAESQKPLGKKYFMAYVRNTFSYEGPLPEKLERIPQDRYGILSTKLWTAFKNSPSIVDCAKQYSIFVINKKQDLPIIGRELFHEMKSQGITGLLEITDFLREEPYERPMEYYDFETVMPLRP